jgi:hypothetical protein
MNRPVAGSKIRYIAGITNIANPESGSQWVDISAHDERWYLGCNIGDVIKTNIEELVSGDGRDRYRHGLHIFLRLLHGGNNRL